MEYIREKLLRQQAVLWGILLGGRGNGRGEIRQERRISPSPGKEPTALGDWNASMEGGYMEDPAMREHGVRERVFRESAEWTVPSKEGVPWVKERVVSGRASTGDASGSNRLFPGGEAPAFSIWGSGGTEGAVMTEHVVTEMVEAPHDDSSSPKLLSRIFERDARRYDGGFRLY